MTTAAPPRSIGSLRAALAAALGLLAGGLAAAQGAAATGGVCRAESGPRTPTVVELYTSEGCSSCPPADRWLSTLKGRDDVIALAFHITYWDRLGWPDRFASDAYTARQYDWSKVFSSRQVYTPQVIADGRDWRGWPQPSSSSSKAIATAAPRLTLQREGDAVLAQVDAADGLPRLAGFWAVTEDSHVSRVQAGENRGETLRHDHVVRLLKAVPAWSAREGVKSRLDVSRGVAEHPRRVIFVVADPATQRPLQALALGC